MSPTTAQNSACPEDALVPTGTAQECQASPAANQSDLQRFLAKVIPWPSGDEQFINIHTLDPAGQFPGMSGRAYQALDQDVFDFINWQAKDKHFFVCMSAQKSAHPPKTDKLGRSYLPASRKGEHAIALKSLFLDIDCKGVEHDSYADQAEAMAALNEFVRTTALPLPTVIVSSGSGLHVHWTLDRALTPDEWNPLARALVEATIKYGLKCDIGVSTDTARVLRVPGTWNHKTTPPKPVELVYIADYDYPVEEIERVLEPYRKINGRALHHEVDPTVLSPKPPINGTGEFAAGIVTRHGAMPQAELRSCLDAIPNTKLDWNWWNKIGMAIYAASGGEEYGLEEWLLWSAKNPNNDGKDSCEKRWQGYHGSPPTQLSGGTLVHEARAAVGDPKWLPTAILTSAGNPGSGPAASLAAGLKMNFSNIPHRRFLYGVDLVRGEITLLASPGGVGKTSVAIGKSVSLATNRPLLKEKLYGGVALKALYVNAEDSRTEMRRRIWAFCLKHGVPEQDLGGLLVAGADDGCVQRLSFLRTEKGNSVLDESGIAHLEALLEDLRPDLLVLDPLIAFCGGGNVNDNAAMSLVMRALKRLAIEFDCAVLIIHHTKKGGDLSNAEAVSGASAIVNLARRAIMVVPMTLDEAKQLGVLPSERFKYFRTVVSKSNLAPPSPDTSWYCLWQVVLPNPEPPTYKSGDGVQAVERVAIPGLAASPAHDDKMIRRAILDAVYRGKVIDGQVFPLAPT